MKTTTPATKILNKIYRQHLIKLARGQSYASNPGGRTPQVSNSAPAPSQANANPSVTGAFFSGMGQGAQNIFSGMGNAAVGLKNTAFGVGESLLGAPLRYAGDTIGSAWSGGKSLAEINPSHWQREGAQSVTDGMNMAAAGLRDTAESFGQMVGVNNAFDASGAYVGAQSPQNAHQQHLARHDKYFSHPNDRYLSAANAGVVTTTDEIARLLPSMGAAPGAVAGLATRFPQLARAGTVLNRAAASNKVVDKALRAGSVATGMPLHPQALNPAGGLARGVGASQMAQYFGPGVAANAAPAIAEQLGASPETVQQVQQTAMNTAQNTMPYLPAVAADSALRTLHPNAPEMIDAVATPALAKQTVLGGAPLSATAPVIGQLQQDRADAAATQMAAAGPAPETVAQSGPAVGGGQMNVADPQATDSQQPAPPKPDEFAAQALPDAAPEVKKQVADSASTVQQAAAENPDAAKAVLDPTGESAQKLAPAAFEKLKAENEADAPTDNPNAYGEWMNGLMTQFNEMDPMAKVALGLGLGTGVIGLISGLMGGGIGSFLLGALGLGAAGAVGASAGMFGEGGSQFMGDMAYNLGTMTGMVPESADLSALKGDNALQRLMTQHSGKIGTRNEVKQQIAGVREQAGKLQQLMSLPLGDDAKVRLIQRLDPSFKTVDEGRQALANAQQILAAYNDPKSELNQKLTQGENYSKLEGWQGDLAEQGVGLLNKLPGALSGIRNRVIDYFKKSNDMNIAQQIIVDELITKAARCWAGYEPVPGKKPYSDGSCRPVGSKKKKKKKTEKKAAGPVLPQSASPPVQSFSKTPFDAQHMVQTLGMHASTKPQMAYNRAMSLWKKNKFTPDQFNVLRDKYQGLPPRPPAAQAAPGMAPQSSAEQAYQQWRSQQGL